MAHPLAPSFAGYGLKLNQQVAGILRALAIRFIVKVCLQFCDGLSIPLEPKKRMSPSQDEAEPHAFDARLFQ
jgi:hypothetical protein